MIVIGTLLWAAAGWLICAAVCLIGWLTDISMPVNSALGLASAFFLLANGVKVVVAGITVSVVPLLLTMAIVTTGVGIVRVAIRHGFGTTPEHPAVRLSGVAVVTAVVYGAATLALAWTTTGGPDVKAAADGLVIGFVVGWWAGAPVCGWHIPWPLSTPAWVRACPRACGAGLGVLGAGGAVLMIVALISASSRVSSLQSGLQPGPGGTTLLAVGQALWSPTLIIWAVAWLVGAGVSLGVGTVVSPVAVDLGVLPSIPVFGAVPDNGAPSPSLLAWFAVPVLAGVVAAWVVSRAQASEDLADERPPRIEVGALIGGASGIITGLAATALAALSRGDLGVNRLAGFGPLLNAMVLLAPTWLGIAGMITGAVLAWRRTFQVDWQPVTPPPAAPKPKPPPQPWLERR